MPGLVANGVLSEPSAEALRRHYSLESSQSSGRNLVLLFFGVLGALLIGGGIILLFAHNWQGLGRPMRTILSFTPLLLAQFLSGWVIQQEKSSAIWRESVSLFHSLAVAACIALIAQTYHMPGAFDSFLLTWMLLSLPLVYLLNALTPLLIYIAGIITWAGYQQSIGEHALYFWPLIALTIPFVWKTLRENPTSPRADLLFKYSMLAGTCALGIVLGKGMPGLWIPFYACLFGGLYLAGGIRWRQEFAGMRFSARIYGAWAIIVLVFVLTWEWPWEEVGWNFLRWRHNTNYDLAALWVDSIIGIVLTGFVVSMLVTSIRRNCPYDMLLGWAAPAVVIAYFIAAVGGAMFSTLLMNFYLLAAGIGLVVQGVRREQLRLFNTGMAIGSLLVIARFFDSGFSFIAKGLVFIVLGILFLLCNFVIVRRKETLG